MTEPETENIPGAEEAEATTEAPETPETEAPEAGSPETASPEAEAPEAGTAEKPEKPEKNRKARKAEQEKLKEELAAEKDKYLRLAAEYDNFRRRSARERENIYADVKADTVGKLLPVYDNLERALKQETADEAYRKGVELTMTQLLTILEGLGVVPIEAVGKTFNPDLHNAVMHLDDPDKGEGEIIQEFQKGFKMGERVIRYSMVQVAN